MQPGDSDHDEARKAAYAGVTPLGKRPPPQRKPAPMAPVVQAAPASFRVLQDDDAGLFWTVPALGKRQAMRHMGKPQRAIDLHGYTGAEAEALLTARIPQLRAQGVRLVRIIYGKGHHSKEGPVLKRLVLRMVWDGPLNGHVLAVRSAPNLPGGLGAGLFLLRKAC